MTIPTKTADLLADLNVLRERNDMPPYKTWKASRAKLIEAIQKLEAPKDTASTEEAPEITKCPPAAAKGAYKKERDAKRSTGVSTKPKVINTGKDQFKVTSGGKASARNVTKGVTRDGTKASDIAREVGIDPRLLRQRLRRLDSNGKLPFKHDGSWTLDNASAIAFVRDVAKELKA